MARGCWRARGGVGTPTVLVLQLLVVMQMLLVAAVGAAGGGGGLLRGSSAATRMRGGNQNTQAATTSSSIPRRHALFPLRRNHDDALAEATTTTTTPRRTRASRRRSNKETTTASSVLRSRMVKVQQEDEGSGTAFIDKALDAGSSVNMTFSTDLDVRLTFALTTEGGVVRLELSALGDTPQLDVHMAVQRDTGLAEPVTLDTITLPGLNTNADPCRVVQYMLCPALAEVGRYYVTQNRVRSGPADGTRVTVTAIALGDPVEGGSNAANEILTLSGVLTCQAQLHFRYELTGDTGRPYLHVARPRYSGVIGELDTLGLPKRFVSEEEYFVFVRQSTCELVQFADLFSDSSGRINANEEQVTVTGNGVWYITLYRPPHNLYNSGGTDRFHAPVRYDIGLCANADANKGCQFVFGTDDMVELQDPRGARRLAVLESTLIPQREARATAVILNLDKAYQLTVNGSSISSIQSEQQQEQQQQQQQQEAAGDGRDGNTAAAPFQSSNAPRLSSAAELPLTPPATILPGSIPYLLWVSVTFQPAEVDLQRPEIVPELFDAMQINVGRRNPQRWRDWDFVHLQTLSTKDGAARKDVPMRWATHICPGWYETEIETGSGDLLASPPASSSSSSLGSPLFLELRSDTAVVADGLVGFESTQGRHVPLFYAQEYTFDHLDMQIFFLNFTGVDLAKVSGKAKLARSRGDFTVRYTKDCPQNVLELPGYTAFRHTKTNYYQLSTTDEGNAALSSDLWYVVVTRVPGRNVTGFTLGYCLGDLCRVVGPDGLSMTDGKRVESDLDGFDFGDEAEILGLPLSTAVPVLAVMAVAVVFLPICGVALTRNVVQRKATLARHRRILDKMAEDKRIAELNRKRTKEDYMREHAEHVSDLPPFPFMPRSDQPSWVMAPLPPLMTANARAQTSQDRAATNASEPGGPLVVANLPRLVTKHDMLMSRMLGQPVGNVRQVMDVRRQYDEAAARRAEMERKVQAKSARHGWDSEGDLSWLGQSDSYGTSEVTEARSKVAAYMKKRPPSLPGVEAMRDNLYVGSRVREIQTIVTPKMETSPRGPIMTRKKVLLTPRRLQDSDELSELEKEDVTKAALARSPLKRLPSEERGMSMDRGRRRGSSASTRQLQVHGRRTNSSSSSTHLAVPTQPHAPLRSSPLAQTRSMENIDDLFTSPHAGTVTSTLSPEMGRMRPSPSAVW